MKLELEGRRALITGALGGIGEACAFALAEEKVDLTLTGRNEVRLTALAARLRVFGIRVDIHSGDIGDTSLQQSLFRAGEEPDLVIHAAGYRFRYAKLHTADPADRAELFRVDVEAFLAIAELAAPPMMQKRFGRFIVITSAAAQLAGAASVPYIAAKSALEGAIRGLAVDYGRYNVTANAVAPGFTRTPRFLERVGAEGENKLASATSTKRISEPVEVANLVAFLASPKAASITGTTLLVDGGLHLGNAW